MDFRPVIVEAPPIGLVEQEHGGERGDAEDAHVRAGKQGELHVHDGLHARRHGEAVRAGGGVALEQRIDHDGCGAGRGALDPEMREGGKFLSRGLGRVDGQAPGGQTVQQILRHGAKVARALKHQELVPDFVRVDVADEAESRQRQRHLAAGMLRHGAHGEHGGRRDQILGHPCLDRGHRDRDRPLIETRPQQLEAKRQAFLAPDRGITVEENGVVLLRAQLVKVAGQGAASRSVGLR